MCVYFLPVMAAVQVGCAHTLHLLLHMRYRNLEGTASIPHQVLPTPLLPRRGWSRRRFMVRLYRHTSEFPGNLRHESSSGRTLGSLPVETRKTHLVIQYGHLVFTGGVTTSNTAPRPNRRRGTGCPTKALSSQQGHGHLGDRELA